MKKAILILLAIILYSCGESDGFKKVNSLDHLNGEWVGGSDILKINSKDKTLQFNDGSIQKISTEDDGFYFFINGYTGNTETFAGSIEINKDEIRIDRIDGGVDLTYKKKVSSPEPEKRDLADKERILSSDVDFYQIANKNSKLRTLKKGTIVEIQHEFEELGFYNIYLPNGAAGEINIGFITIESVD